MPSESFNEQQAYDVAEGFLDINDCEDPDAVSNILEGQYNEYAGYNYGSYNNPNYNQSNSSKNKNSDNNTLCCLIMVIFWLIFLFMWIF